jgi:DNA repair and recombination protein RAD54 and RAD54-like protein
MICCPNTVCLLPYTVATRNNSQSLAVPAKYEQVVFCGLSPFQLSLYRLFISSPEIKALLRGQDSQPLKAINILKKLCNHPELLDLPGDLRGSDHLIPEGFVGAGGNAKGGTSRDKGRSHSHGVRCDWAGKFSVLERYGALLCIPHVN